MPVRLLRGRVYELVVLNPHDPGRGCDGEGEWSVAFAGAADEIWHWSTPPAPVSSCPVHAGAIRPEHTGMHEVQFSVVGVPAAELALSIRSDSLLMDHTSVYGAMAGGLSILVGAVGAALFCLSKRRYS